jgi:hypothetical protein
MTGPDRGPSRTSRIAAILGITVALTTTVVVSGALGWQSGLDHRPDFRDENPLHVLVVLAYGAVGALIFILCALFLLSIPVITLTARRRRREGGRKPGGRSSIDVQVSTDATEGEKPHRR